MNKDQVMFATGNAEKFNSAYLLCRQKGIDLVQVDIETAEIQSEDATEVIVHKAKAKFEQSGKQPLIVSDDSWDIPALNGFPGPYMKSIDHWFTPQVFLDLAAHLNDRRILLHQHLAFIDNNHLQLFVTTIPGTITTEARGTYGKPMQKVIALDRDQGLTIAEVYDRGMQHNPDRFDPKTDVWNKFITWYTKNGRKG